MFYNKRNLTVVFMFVCMINAIAQTQAPEKWLQEKVVLTTDRTIYFSGELIWLKASSTLSTSTDSLSRVMYVELLDKKAKPVVQQKFQIISGISSGLMNVPEDIITGNYYIRAYTQYMRNFDKALFYTTELTIINPDLPSKDGIQTIFKDSSDLILEKQPQMIGVKLPSTVFSPNSLIQLELEGKETKDVSVSVVKKGSFEAGKVGVNRYYKTSLASSGKKINWYPEIRSVSITGKVVDKQTGEPMKNSMVYAAIADTVKQFHVAKTNVEGAFVFALPNLHDNHQVYIGVEQEAKILVNPDFASGLPAADYTTLKMDDAKKNLLNRMYVNEQVTTVYKENPSLVKTYLDTLPDPFESSSETIFFKDYVALPSMTDMFNEIIPYTKVKIKKEGSIIQLADKKDKTFFENPLILLDNIPFHDHTALLNIPPSKINSVSVIAGRYVYGGEIINGIIEIRSKDSNLAGLQLPNDIVVLDYITYNPDVKVSFDKSAGFSASRPGFKNTLYWDPHVYFKDGKQTIQFSSGNELSDYDIVLRGTDAQGNVFTKIESISVR